jgi:putative phosphoribosyl transferase
LSRGNSSGSINVAVDRCKDMVEEGKTFIDRRDAGFEVGKLLEPRYKNRDVLVLGIPRGGVEVAYEVANVLNGQLSVIITKKLPHPLQHEFAVGAVAEDGSVYLTSSGRVLSEQTIKQTVNNQLKEIQSRIERFRNGKSLPAMMGRIVIIADDGIATGSTIVSAIKLCRSRGAAKVIVAAPVSGKHYAPEINGLADEVIVVQQPEDFYAVGQVYEDFHNLSDEEVITLLRDFDQKNAFGNT